MRQAGNVPLLPGRCPDLKTGHPGRQTLFVDSAHVRPVPRYHCFDSKSHHSPCLPNGSRSAASRTTVTLQIVNRSTRADWRLHFSTNMEASDLFTWPTKHIESYAVQKSAIVFLSVRCGYRV